MASTIAAGTTAGTAIAIAGDTSGALAFQTNGTTTAMTIDTSQRVGVGTTSPAAPLDVQSTTDALVRIKSGSGYSAGLNIMGNAATVDSNNVLLWQGSSNECYFYNRANSFIAFGSNNTERMRIASSGELLMSKTAIDTTGAGSYFEPAASLGYARLNMIKNSSSGTSATPAIAFYYSGTGGVGSIQCTSTATAYNTSSDYRLKENIAPMTGALQTVSLLKPVTYNWKTDGSNGQGFIAHELQAIIPDAVCGEKDAIDKDGNPIYQGIDTSFLVATLTAAIQELNAKVEAQAVRIAELEGAK